MILREKYCPECGNIVDAPTDGDYFNADEVKSVEMDKPCERCKNGGSRALEV